MRIQSIFIDESGDFGAYEPHCPYYLITLVFHDQGKPIGGEVAHLKRHVVELGFSDEHSIHSGPLIRREKDYAGLGMPERRKLFHSLATFIRFCEVKYKTFAFPKSEFATSDELVTRMAREVGAFVRNADFLQACDRVIVYYDNGQKEITRIINSVFSALLPVVEIRRVAPSDYCLFQAADMVCTLELLAKKAEAGCLSKSESDFFRGVRNLKKNYLKPIRKKSLG